MWTKVLKWFFLSFLLSLLPFGLSALILLVHAAPVGGFDAFARAWERGELCLVSIALVAAGIGDVAGSNMRVLKNVKIAVICLSLVFLLTATA